MPAEFPTSAEKLAYEQMTPKQAELSKIFEIAKKLEVSEPWKKRAEELPPASAGWSSQTV